MYAGDEVYGDEVTSGALPGVRMVTHSVGDDCPGGHRCPATLEAVEEAEEAGDVGCPLCGEPPTAHQPEVA
jgi:hypothetical protein